MKGQGKSIEEMLIDIVVKQMGKDKKVSIEIQYSRDTFYNKTTTTTISEINSHLPFQLLSNDSKMKRILKLYNTGFCSHFLSVHWSHPDDAHFDSTQSLSIKINIIED